MVFMVALERMDKNTQNVHRDQLEEAFETEYQKV
jgi:hypothetical protein